MLVGYRVNLKDLGVDSKHSQKESRMNSIDTIDEAAEN